MDDAGIRGSGCRAVEEVYTDPRSGFRLGKHWVRVGRLLPQSHTRVSALLPMRSCHHVGFESESDCDWKMRSKKTLEKASRPRTRMDPGKKNLAHPTRSSRREDLGRRWGTALAVTQSDSTPLLVFQPPNPQSVETTQSITKHSRRHFRATVQNRCTFSENVAI